MIAGDIWRVNLAVPPGDTQDPEAEAIVVQDAAYGRGSPLVLVVPITHDPTANGLAGTVGMQDASETLAEAVALVFQLRGISRERFVEKVGELSEEGLNAVLAEVDRLTGRTPKPVD